MPQVGRSLSLRQIREISTRAARLIVALGQTGGIVRVLAGDKDPFGRTCFSVSYFRRGRAQYCQYSSSSLLEAAESLCDSLLQDKEYKDVSHALAFAMSDESMPTASVAERSEEENKLEQKRRRDQVNAIAEMLVLDLDTEEKMLRLAFVAVGGDAQSIPSRLVLEAIFDSAKEVVAKYQGAIHLPEYEPDPSCKQGMPIPHGGDYHCTAASDLSRVSRDHVQNFELAPVVPKISDSFHDHDGPTPGGSLDADRDEK